MRKKFLTLLVVGLSGLLFLAVGVLVAAEVPEKILIQNTGYKRITKGPVPFDHKKHQTDYKIACTECHHKYENGKNVWKEGDPVQPCKACHSPLKSQGKIVKLELAFHKNCRNCHRELKKEGKKTGPTTCNKCHEKKS
jgi:hypothetical protein